MKLIFAGTTPNAVDVLRYLVDSAQHEIVAVLTRHDAPLGRKKIVTPSAVAAYAQSANLRVIKANRVDEQVDSELAALEADLGVVVAYGALLKKRTLAIPARGWINVHFSLLPKYRGAAPVQRTLMAGNTETGVTIFQLDEGLDTGPIHSQLATQIEPDENAAELLNRLTHLSITMLDECLAKISANLERPQEQHGQATLAPKLSRIDSRIDFDLSARELENLVRGSNPEPMAWATLDTEPFRVLRARASKVELPPSILPGEVFKIEDRIFVATKQLDALELIEVQPASKTAMPAAEWHRGRSNKVKLE